MAAAVALAQKETLGVPPGDEGATSTTEQATSAATLAAILKTNALEKVMGGSGGGANVENVAKEETVPAEDDVVASNEKERRKRDKKNPKHPKTIPCPACLKVFHSVKTLKIHVTRSHPDLDPDAGYLKSVFEIDKTFHCKECGKTFSNKQTMKIHVEAIHMGKTYSCDVVCEVFFTRFP